MGTQFQSRMTMIPMRWSKRYSVKESFLLISYVALITSLIFPTNSLAADEIQSEVTPIAQPAATNTLSETKVTQIPTVTPPGTLDKEAVKFAYQRPNRPVPDYIDPRDRQRPAKTHYGKGHDRSQTVTISVQHADLAEVFQMMSKHGQVNILMANGVQGQVSINLYDIDLHEAIRAVAIAAGFAVEKSGSTYFVVTRDEAGKEIVGGLTKVKSYKVQYSEPEAVATIIKDHLSRYGKVTALPDRKLIVVEDLPEFLIRVESLLEEVDHQPVQIMIEAQILEVKLDRTESYGIDWAKLFSVGDFAVETAGLAGPANGLFFSVTNSNLDVVLSALSDKNRVRTLSTPKLLALEHEEAEVIIGTRQGYKEVTTSQNGNTESIQFLDAGVILKVTPFVDRSGQIMMEIHPEVSSATLDVNGIPSLQTTEVTTQLLANDGQTIFIGGLIQNSDSTGRTGVPVLGDIPVLGYAFRKEADTVNNTETVVMITPRIVKPRQVTYSTERVENEIKVREVDVTLKNESDLIEDHFKNHKPISKKFWPFK